jgi:type II secretory pathway pseudopilin PulG
MNRMKGGIMKRSGERGFTLVELAIYMVLTSIAMAAVLGMFISQSRQYRGQFETTDVRETLRGGVELLAGQIRSAVPSRGDLYAIADQSLQLRAPYAVGDVCTVSADTTRYGIWAPQGTFEQLQASDSVLVANGTGTWVAMKLTQVWDDPVAAGVPNCDWPAAPVPNLAVEVVKNGSGFGDTGALLQLFRPVEYGMVDAGGRWWLGRKLWDETDYTLLTGPLSDPSDDGLSFYYYDASGDETNDPAQVARIRIELRGESQSASDLRRETLTTSIRLRN